MQETSIKVGVRVRPLSKEESESGCISCLSYPSQRDQLMIGHDKLFSFDSVFHEATTQESLYTNTALSMVDTVLRGYNATLLAYGQTGSGKTYSMGTCAIQDVTDGGIVPRMVQDIFSLIPSMPFEYVIKVSYLEIPGLTECSVTSCDEVLNLLHSGSTKRSVGGTAMNRQSSRSHAIFTLHFVLRPRQPTDEKSTMLSGGGNSPGGDETLTAKLHLVDLAGSERLKRTHAEGDRLKEGININRGLLALGNVISALCEKDAKKRSHIPYRDSRLTRLLQDSLGGNSTTFMLACVSPADSDMEETLNTLRYADRARLIKNKPILNRADPKDAELARLRSLVTQLQLRLKQGPVSSLLMSPREIKPSCSSVMSNALPGLMQNLTKLELLLNKIDEDLTADDEEFKCSASVGFISPSGDGRISQMSTSLKKEFSPAVDSLDDEGHELRARRLVCKEQMQSIEANLKEKQALLHSLESAVVSDGADTHGESSYVVLLEQYESQVQELEARICKMQEERERLLSDNQESKATKEKRLVDMEHGLADSRKQLAELGRLRKAKEARESECKQLRDSIQMLRASMVQKAKQLKEESSIYRRWRTEKDKEVRRLQVHDRRMQTEMSQMAAAHQRQQAVLKRRMEAAAATERRLKEMLALQRDRRNDKRVSDNAGNMSKSDWAARVRNGINSDLDLQVGLSEARFHLNQLIESRRTLCVDLRAAEATLEQTGSPEAHQQVATLNEAVESQTRHIANLQQKLLDVGERDGSVNSAGTSAAAASSVDQVISSRLSQMHNMHETKIALKHLFKETVAARLQKLIAENRVSELEAQLTESVEHMAQNDSLWSAQLADSSEQLTHLQSVVDRMEVENSNLRKQEEELKRVVNRLKRADRKPTQLVRCLSMASPPGDNRNTRFRRLSGTPVFSNSRRLTRYTLAMRQQKQMPISPLILAPDSVKQRRDTLWNVFDENQEVHSDSSIQDPTWRVPLVPTELKSAETIRSQTINGCKCRGSCTNRCGCFRAGQMCSDSQCKCAGDKCRNRVPRSDPSSPGGAPIQSIQVGPRREQHQIMGPPASPPAAVEKKKRRRVERSPLASLHPCNSPNSAPGPLNTTFDLSDTDNVDVEVAHELEDEMEISQATVGGGQRHLWPKNRLSYFPSPSCRPDMQ